MSTAAQLAAQLGLPHPHPIRRLHHARQIVSTIAAMRLPGDQGERAADIALATALVESGLLNYANGNNPASLALRHDAVGWDHGSVGVFQQQVGGAPNSTADWGTTAQCMDVEYATKHFVRVLLSRDWLHMSNGAAAQSVQGSSFPDRYAQRDAQAIRIRRALWPEHAPKPKPPAKKPPAKKPPAKAGRTVYTVQAGDNLSAIAKRHRVSLAALQKANPRAGHPAGNFDLIQPGDRLTIPG